MQVSELDELRDKAYHNAMMYNDRRIKVMEFEPGNKVLLVNSRMKLFSYGKLWSKWLGPYTVVDTSPHGAVMLHDNEGNDFKVYGHRLDFVEWIDLMCILGTNPSLVLAQQGTQASLVGSVELVQVPPALALALLAC